MIVLGVELRTFGFKTVHFVKPILLMLISPTFPLFDGTFRVLSTTFLIEQ